MGRGSQAPGPRPLLYGERGERGSAGISAQQQVARAKLSLDRGKVEAMVGLLDGELDAVLAREIIAALGQSAPLALPPVEDRDEQLIQALERAGAVLHLQDKITPEALRREIDLQRERVIIDSLGRADQALVRWWGYQHGAELFERHGLRMRHVPGMVVGLGQQAWGANKDILAGREPFVGLGQGARALSEAESFVVRHQQRLLERLDFLDEGIGDKASLDLIRGTVSLTLNELSNLEIAEELVTAHGTRAWKALVETAATWSPQPIDEGERDNVLAAIDDCVTTIQQREPDYRPEVGEMAVCVAQMTSPEADGKTWGAARLALKVVSNRCDSRRPMEKLLTLDDIAELRQDPNKAAEVRKYCLMSLGGHSDEELCQILNYHRARPGRVMKITSEVKAPLPSRGTVGICGGLLDGRRPTIYWPWAAGESSLPNSYPYQLVGAPDHRPGL